MFVTIFVEIYGKPGRKTLLTRPVPSILKYLTEVKSGIDFQKVFIFLRCQKEV